MPSCQNDFGARDCYLKREWVLLGPVSLPARSDGFSPVLPPPPPDLIDLVDHKFGWKKRNTLMPASSMFFFLHCDFSCCKDLANQNAGIITEWINEKVLRLPLQKYCSAHAVSPFRHLRSPAAVVGQGL